jgi:hypothetical protein
VTGGPIAVPETPGRAMLPGGAYRAKPGRAG